MAVAPGTGNLEVTLGITSASMAVYNPLGAFGFTAMAWHYVGPNGTRRNLWYLGTDTTPFDGSAYICVFLSTTGVLTLEIFDGSTTHTHTGGTLAENTWFHWAYVRSTASNHKVYRALDGSLSASVLDIDQTITDTVAPAGLFVFIPPSMRVANFKIFRNASTVTVVSQERESWELVSGTANWNTSSFRLPDDLYNYSGTEGGTAWSDPTNTTTAVRTHFTNVGSRPVAYATDPANLVAKQSPTAILYTIDPEVAFNPGGTPYTDDRTVYHFSTSNAFGLPSAAVLQNVVIWTTGGVSGSGTGSAQRKGSVGTVSGVATETGAAASGLGMSHRRHTWTGAFSIAQDPITGELWNTLEPAVARDRINAYFWGWVVTYLGDPLTLTVRELLLRIGYIWDGTLDCVCAPRTEYGGGFGYTACCGPTVEGGTPFAALPFQQTCDGDGLGGPDGVNGSDAENWAQ